MLKHLKVSQIKISRLPDSLGAFTNLEGLYFSRTKISMLSHSKDALKLLKLLYVSQIEISRLSDSIGAITNLEELYLSQKYQYFHIQ